MQKYTEIDENKTLRESRELLLNNDKTAISCNSGPAFPTINLQPGMLCFRTDEQKLYQLNANGETWIELFDLSGNIGLVSRATTADNALEVNGHTVNSDVPVNAEFTDTTYGTVTDSASGLMTSAQKKKLDGLSNYSLPVASATTLGGVKIGDGLTITNGILSSGVTGGNATHGEQLFTANGTFVVPEGVSLLVVTAVGGGGGGGGGGYSGSSGSANSGANGTSGVMIENRTVFVNEGQTLAVIIGRGGNGGNAASNGWDEGAGGAAGDSSTGTAGGYGGHGYNGVGAGGGGGGAGGATKLGEAVIARGGNGGTGGKGGNTEGGAGGNTSSKIAVSAESLELSSSLNSHTYGVYGAAGAGGAGGGGNGTAGFLFIRW